jgi:hypothetical protein
MLFPPLEFRLSGGEIAQAFFPFGFQPARHQHVFGLDRRVLTLCTFCFVASTFHCQASLPQRCIRCKKRLWREAGRERLEAFPLAPWASRRRHDLLEVLDRLNPTITELSQAIEQEAEKCPEAERLRTHPGVGSLTALAFVADHPGTRNGFSVASRSRAIWDWCRQKIPAGIGDDSVTSASKAMRCCVSCWWKRRK